MTEKTLAEYRCVIDSHGLEVSKGVGGRNKRTKEHLRDDIVTALRLPIQDYARQVGRLKVGDDTDFVKVRQKLSNDIDSIVAYLAEWLPVSQALDIFAEEIYDKVCAHADDDNQKSK